MFALAAAFFGFLVQFLKDRDGGFGAIFGGFWENNGAIVIAMACLMPAFIRDTLRMSNRVAGPIHNLHKVCKQIADGDPEVRPLKFRDDDMFQYLPADFNRMVERLQNGHPKADVSEVTECEAELTPANA